MCPVFDGEVPVFGAEGLLVDQDGADAFDEILDFALYWVLFLMAGRGWVYDDVVCSEEVGCKAGVVFC